MNRRARLLSAVTLLMMLLITGCSQEAEVVSEEKVAEVLVKDSNPLVAQQVTKVGYGEVIKRDLYNGVVTPYVEELYFNSEGTFLEYTVAIGETVKKGQVLARTDTSKIEKQVAELEEQIAKLTDNYTYQMTTLKNKEETIEKEMKINYWYLEITDYLSPDYTQLCMTLGRQDSSLKTNQLEQNQLTERYELELPYLTGKLEEQKAKLNKNVIKAPFSGVIVQLRSIAGGENVNTQQPYVAIGDTNRYQVVSDYVSSSIIDKAEGVYAFINGKQYELTYVPMDKERYSKVMSGSGKAYSTYEIEPDETFDFGQMVKLSVVRESRPNVLRVANIAVLQEGNNRYCYVKDGTERKKVPIEIGLNDGMYYEVISGLKEGDEVFVE